MVAVTMVKLKYDDSYGPVTQSTGSNEGLYYHTYS